MENYPKYFYGVIYKVTNLVNNKCYIGKTIQNPKKYIQQHFKNAFSNYEQECKYFYNAIRKYGEKNFKWRILGFCYSHEELNQAEIDCIYFYRSFGSNGENVDDIYGYNLTKGGDGVVGYIFSEEEREIRSIRFKGKKLSKEHRNKISKAHIGKKLSDTTKEKISLLYKDKTYEEIHGENAQKVRERLSESQKLAYKEGRRTAICKGETYEEFYGEEKAKKIKNKQSEKSKGRKHTEESINKIKKAHKGKIILDKQKKFLSNYWKESRRMIKNNKTKLVRKIDLFEYLNKGWRFYTKRKGVLKIQY